MYVSASVLTVSTGVCSCSDSAYVYVCIWNIGAVSAWFHQGSGLPCAGGAGHPTVLRGDPSVPTHTQEPVCAVLPVLLAGWPGAHRSSCTVLAEKRLQVAQPI